MGECPAYKYEAWPEQMRAETAAAFCDEVSVEAFLRGVGKLYPPPHRVAGKGDRWLKGELVAAIRRNHGQEAEVQDAADVL